MAADRMETSSALAAVLRFRCSACGAKVSRRDRPGCPNCDGTLLDPAPWRPFSARPRALT